MKSVDFAALGTAPRSGAFSLFKSVEEAKSLILVGSCNLIEGASFKTPQDVKNLFGVNVDFVGKQRELNLRQVRALAKRFKVSPEVFIK